MDGELAREDKVLAAGLFKELFGEFGTFAVGEHPADGVRAEDVKNDLEIEIGPLGWAEQFGDVPVPERIGG